MSSEVDRLQQELQAAREEIAHRDALLAVIAHELRNPIAPVLLALDAMVLEVQNTAVLDRETVMRRLLQTRRYAHRLRGDLDRLLDFSRARAGHVEIRPVAGDLSQLVAACLDDMLPMLQHAQCELRTHLQRPLAGRWDPMRITQIVWNLVSNAAKYAAGAPIDVTTSGDGDTATLIIADHGPGIPSERHDEVFSQFMRATQQAHTGFGIGLWLVRGIVRAMGGTIALASTAGAGTTFTVTLPWREQQ